MSATIRSVLIGTLTVISFSAVSNLRGQVPSTDYPLFAFSNAFNQAGKPAIPLAKRAEWLLKYGYAGVEHNDPTTIIEFKELLAARDLRVFASYVTVNIDEEIAYDTSWHEVIPHFAGEDWIIWVNVQSGRYGSSDPAADGLVVDKLGKLVRMAERHGVRVVLYPHYGYLVETAADANRIAQRMDEENVGVAFNLCHYLRTEGGVGVEATLREVLPKLFMVSVSGADTGATQVMNWDRLIQPLGQGTFPLADFMRTLADVGYRGAVGQQCYGIDLPVDSLLRMSSSYWEALPFRSTSVLQRRVWQLDTLYTSLYSFLAKCYDPASGGFYEDTLRKGRPKLESSARAITMLDKAGMLDRLPQKSRAAMVGFFQRHQDPQTGFFEDSQEKRDGHTRRGRAMGYSTGALRKLGAAPLYDLPDTDTPGMEHLRSGETFVEWLAEQDWDNPWGAGSKISAQKALIQTLPEEVRSEVLEQGFKWLAGQQDAVSGWWGKDSPYRMLSGAFKLGIFYSAFNREMPRRDKLLSSALEVIEHEPCHDACFVRNTMHLLNFIDPGYARITGRDREIIVERSIANIAAFRRSDGGFARHLNQQYGVTDGCSQAMKTRDALRELVGLPAARFPGGEAFLEVLD